MRFILMLMISAACYAGDVWLVQWTTYVKGDPCSTDTSGKEVITYEVSK